MAPSKLTLLKTRVKSIKSTIESARSTERGNHASVQTMELVNKLISDTAQQFPDLADSLPAPFKNIAPHAAMMGVSDHSFMDIEICVDQVLSLLDLMDEG